MIQTEKPLNDQNSQIGLFNLIDLFFSKIFYLVITFIISLVLSIFLFSFLNNELTISIKIEKPFNLSFSKVYENELIIDDEQLYQIFKNKIYNLKRDEENNPIQQLVFLNDIFSYTKKNTSYSEITNDLMKILKNIENEIYSQFKKELEKQIIELKSKVDSLTSLERKNILISIDELQRKNEVYVEIQSQHLQSEIKRLKNELEIAEKMGIIKPNYELIDSFGIFYKNSTFVNLSGEFQKEPFINYYFGTEALNAHIKSLKQKSENFETTQVYIDNQTSIREKQLELENISNAEIKELNFRLTSVENLYNTLTSKNIAFFNYNSSEIKTSTNMDIRIFLLIPFVLIIFQYFYFLYFYIKRNLSQK